MTQAGGRKQTKLSQRQQDILLWLTEQEERPPVELIGTSDTATATEGAILIITADASGQGSSRARGKGHIVAPLSTANGECTQVKKIGTRWSVKAFFKAKYGREPTPSEISSCARSLERLEQQGFVKRTASRGKRKKTSHIKRTEEAIRNRHTYDLRMQPVEIMEGD